MRIVEIVYRYEAVEARARPETPGAARARLERGNVDFAALIDRLEDGVDRVARHVVHIDPRELGAHTGGEAPLQRPFAVVLGCADARVPIELVFHEGPNDLFVVRVAGNVLGPDILGSLRYAIESLGDSLQLIVVLGHSGYRAALTELSVIYNAVLSAYAIRREIEKHGALGAFGAVYGVYEIATRRVWAPLAGDGENLGLADPPADLAGFRALGRAAAESARIRELLAG